MGALIPQDMKLGAWVSGIGHTGLFLWLIIGGFFFARENLTDLTITDVSIVTSEEFAALQPSSPDTGETPSTLPVPQIEDTPSLPEPTPDAAPATEEPTRPVTPEPEPNPAPAPEPETPVIVDESVPISPEPPVESAAPDVAEDAVPVPAPAPRVAPEPSPEPEPEVVIAPEEQAPTAPSEETSDVQEAQEETAPEAAAEEIVTEAEEPSNAAPVKSIRPPSRPKRPPPPAEVAEETTEEVPGLAESIDSALTEANSENAVEDNANPGAASGPPITGSEKEAFILAIRQCWNVGALSSDALRVTVIIGVAMNQDGTPDNGSIRMISSDGGSSAAVKQAFEAGRRAIIRCGTRGYDLPTEKYAQWQNVQITFNPERMRIK